MGSVPSVVCAAVRCGVQLSHEDTRIVSLTVTEKGYCQDVNGDLDRVSARPWRERSCRVGIDEVLVGLAVFWRERGMHLRLF